MRGTAKILVWGGTITASALCLLAAASHGIPRWTQAGARVVMHEPLAPLGSFPVELSADARITLHGDSNMAGNRLQDSGRTFARVMVASHSPPAEVTSLARGGSTAVQGFQRAVESRCGDLAIVMFGTNDAAPRGLLSRRAPESHAAFASALDSLVTHCLADGAQVLVLAAPPAGTSAMERRIAPYRAQARSVAAANGVNFLDPASAFSGENARGDLLQHDALHLSEEAHALIASWLASYVTLSASDD